MDLFSGSFSDSLKKVGVLPVVCLQNEKELHTFSEAVLRSKVRCIEITLRHPFSPTAIRYIKKHHPEITVGAGTVKTAEALYESMESGADYCVSPGTNEKLLEIAFQKNMPFLPGCTTPTECMHLASLGYRTVKFFPAECAGGVKALKLFEGAFSELFFLPTGGITMDNFADYLRCKNVIACGGSFMVPKAALTAGDSDGILRAIEKCTDLRCHV